MNRSQIHLIVSAVLSLPRIFLPCIRSFVFGLCVVLLHSPMVRATPVFEPLQAFVLSPKNPQAKLIQGSDGNFYGTTYYGGTNSKGAVFKMTPAGIMTTLVNFTGTNGTNPAAGLVQGSDGNFYGTTQSGGSSASGRGTVFKMTPAGVLTTLVNFTVNFTHGYDPRAGLVQGNDGNFYGTTYGGGTGSKGTVFKMTPAGVLTTLVIFTGTNGKNPTAGLVQDSDGNFYGTTSSGGSGIDYGTVFKMTPAGDLTTLVNFDSSTARYPKAELVQGSDGNFYGTTSGGGSSNFGTVFKMTPEGALTTLVDFTVTNGNYPRTGLVQGSEGNFYGTTYGDFSHGGNGTVFKMTPTGGLTTLVNFSDTHGSYPRAGLAQGGDGNFYGTTTGTTSQGSSSSSGATVFRITPAGDLTTLVKFDPTAHSFNQAGLMLGSDGNFYGTTPGVGNNIDGSSSDYGKVFKMTPAGDLTILANFNYLNGFLPQAELIQGRDGNFYGTTHSGGDILIDNLYTNFGSIFMMTPAGALTNLVSFLGDNGMELNSRLVQGSDGNFYGTAPFGGTSSSRDGTVFRMTPAGGLTVLVNFTGANGSGPEAALVQGSDGNFYGTTSKGGSSGTGTIFKMTPAGALTTLVNFGYPNGDFPIAGLLQGSDGNFYGTTSYGGSGSKGTVFKMTPAGDMTTLVNFTGANGSSPNELVLGSDGNLYGVTSEGGSTPDGQFAGGGQIFRVRMGPSVTTLPAGSITSSSVQLNATVNPGGYDAPVAFQYGISPTLVTYATASAGTLTAGTAPVSAQVDLTGLSANTVYYYRVVASNAENTVPQTGLILSFTTGAVSPGLSLFNTAAASAGLSGPNFLPTAMPFGDGVTNLVKYAFNMNLGQPDVSVLGASGNSGLPRVTLEANGAQKVLRMEFLRRIDSGLSYTPQSSSTLDGFVPMSGTQTITPIDAQWERVSVEVLSTAPSNFARVQVEMP